MKKLALLLAVALFAAPAMAVTVSVVPTDPLTAEIQYDAEGEDIAAFALDVTVDAGVIESVTPAKVGVSVAGDEGFGIFPANFDRFITVNAQGGVDDWNVTGYGPVADVNDPGAAGGLGSDAITIELGALYKGDGNKPAQTGTLCTITVSEGCTMSLALNELRGGIVTAGAGEPASTTLVGADIPGVIDECLSPDDPGYDDWVAFGKPDCWCYVRQCHGDADGQLEGGGKIPLRAVGTADLNVLISAWSVHEPDSPVQPGPGIMSVEGAVCADFDHAAEGGGKIPLRRVGTADLNILIENWTKHEPDSPVQPGPGVPKDCQPEGYGIDLD